MTQPRAICSHPRPPRGHCRARANCRRLLRLALAAQPHSTNARKRLDEIKASTLIVVGEKDLSYFRDIAEVMASGILHAQKVIMPGVGHMVNMEAAAECNKLLTEHF